MVKGRFMRYREILLFAVVLTALLGRAAAEAKDGQPEAVVFVVGDQHSAYEKTAQLVATIDQIKSRYPTLPLAILIDGDTFEYGNIVARRSSGAVEFAMFAALAKRGPTILNLGNHEPEFYDLNETVRRIEATGVKVISNIINHSTGRPFAPASEKITLGNAAVTIVGVTTDHLATYRVAVRPSLDLANPVIWAKQNFPALFDVTSLPIVMSHAGLNADREILSFVPNGTLFAGAHDHLRFVHSLGRGVYFHSGAWNEYLSVAWLKRDRAGVPFWTVEQVQIPGNGAFDAKLTDLIRATRGKYVTPEDTMTVGHAVAAKSPQDAARWVTELLAASAQVDAAFVGNTTFGAGLPAGPIDRLQLDACIRFDGTIFAAEIDGARMQKLIAAANQGVDVPFDQRQGEFLVASAPAQIEPTKRYRVATTDWGVRNSQNYFGLPAIEWHELPGAKFKARVIGRLNEP